MASESSEWKPFNPEPASTQLVWQVALATSAAPPFFAPIHFEDKVFVDGGILANNPTQEALREIAYLYGELAGTCVVSIGSGISDKPLLPASLFNGKRTGFLGSKNIVRILRDAVTETELTNTDVHFEASMNAEFAYFRFNTRLNRYINLDDWDASGRTRRDIELSTEEYLSSESTKTQLHRCATVIAARMAGTTQYYLGNVHFVVPRAPNSLFTGRDYVLHHIRECLTLRKNDQVDLPRRFVITGMGGQGKSEICLKLAHDMREE